MADDLDAAVAHFREKFGTGEFTVIRNLTVEHAYVDGKPVDAWSIDVALVNAGGTNLEIIRPTGGAVEMYRNVIRPGAPATFHHIGVLVSSLDEATKILKENGKDWTMTGYGSGLAWIGYVDMTAELGHFVECVALEPAGVKFFEDLEKSSNV